MPKPKKETKESRKRAIKEAIEKDERFSQKINDPVIFIMFINFLAFQTY